MEELVERVLLNGPSVAHVDAKLLLQLLQLLLLEVGLFGCQ